MQAFVGTMYYTIMLYSIVLLVTVAGHVTGKLSMEPVCSKFDYEYRTLEAALRTERYVDDIKKEMTTIQTHVKEKLEQLTEFKRDLEQSLAELGVRLDGDIAKTRTESQAVKLDIEEKMRMFESNISKISSRQADPVVAFTAVDPTLKTVVGVPTFQLVVTNVGENYNQETGMFTCSIAGLYAFTFSVGSKVDNKNVYCRIQHNGRNVVISQVYKPQYSVSSNTIYLILAKGDIVSPGDCGGVEYFYNWNKATTFSGVLLAVV